MIHFKKSMAILLSACCITGGISAYAASISASVTITKNDDSKESSSVGISKSAEYKATNSSSSSGNLTMSAYACWTGWPYTCESSVNIAPSGNYSYTEKQDKDSNYYIKLTGNKKCVGSGSVKVK